MTETVSKMTQHDKADREIGECRDRRQAAEAVCCEWVERMDKLVLQWEELSNTVSWQPGTVAQWRVTRFEACCTNSIEFAQINNFNVPTSVS